MIEPGASTLATGTAVPAAPTALCAKPCTLVTPSVDDLTERGAPHASLALGGGLQREDGRFPPPLASPWLTPPLTRPYVIVPRKDKIHVSSVFSFSRTHARRIP